MNERLTSQVLMIGSVASVLLAGYGFLVGDFWLASTQWLGIAAVLAIWAVWIRLK